LTGIDSSAQRRRMFPSRFRPLFALLAGAMLMSTATTQESDSAIAIGAEASGRIVWMKMFASPGDDWINDIVPLGDSNHLAVGFLGRDDSADAADCRAARRSLLVAGYSDALGGGGQDAFVIRIADGSWRRPHPAFIRRSPPRD
jgi:hypothetical protein